MTHHERPSFTLSDTTFHFVGGDPATVLEQARDAAGSKDVRLGGGATTIRQFLDADLVDTMHVVVSPVQLGSGVRLWESPMSCSTGFISRLCRAPAVWHTTCSGAGDHFARLTCGEPAPAGSRRAESSRAASSARLRTPVFA